MTHETKLAEQIVAVLPAGSVARVLCDDPEMIRFAVQNSSLKLRSVVFSRSSLRRLLRDAARDVKVEYLQRDLLRSAVRRAEFRYPRLSEIVASVRGRRHKTVAFALGVATFGRL
jgi:hypothetical protein